MSSKSLFFSPPAVRGENHAHNIEIVGYSGIMHIWCSYSQGSCFGNTSSDLGFRMYCDIAYISYPSPLKMAGWLRKLPTLLAQTDGSSENSRKWTGFCILTVPCRCWKSYLPCSKRSENIINRKSRNFYIEAIPNFFSQLRKKIYFFRTRKKFGDIFQILNFGKDSFVN